MDKFVIRGGNPLVGSVRISGAKNAALPAMAAALLTDEPVILENIPDVRDIHTERNLLVSMGEAPAKFCQTAGATVNNRWFSVRTMASLSVALRSCYAIIESALPRTV